MKILFLPFMALVLSTCFPSCAPQSDQPGPTSSADSQYTRKGEILGIQTRSVVRPAKARGVVSSVGSRLAGAAAGGNIFSSIGASLGGRYAGEAISGKGEKVYVTETVVRLDSGEIVTIPSEASGSRARKVGQKVSVLQTGDSYEIL